MVLIGRIRLCSCTPASPSSSVAPGRKEDRRDVWLDRRRWSDLSTDGYSVGSRQRASDDLRRHKTTIFICSAELKKLLRSDRSTEAPSGPVRNAAHGWHSSVCVRKDWVAAYMAGKEATRGHSAIVYLLTETTRGSYVVYIVQFDCRWFVFSFSLRRLIRNSAVIRSRPMREPSSSRKYYYKYRYIYPYACNVTCRRLFWNIL